MQTVALTLPILDRLRRKGRLLAGLVLLVALWGCDKRELPEDYRDIPVPGALLRSPEARSAGAKLFYMHCSTCHGENADGQGSIRRHLSSNPVDFTSREWRDQVTERWVYYVVREGRTHSAMAGWNHRLDDDACWNLTAHVLSVSED